jgi:hypothetical protein
MKIFISHSSKDKWAARRIAEDLHNIGATTFLDEKDIRTGQSLDESIKAHIKDSNDFLILLSPSSLKSEWVLVELGGAMALEKRIVPILLYVGANEVPQIINLRLSRDINDIDRYYQEVSNEINTKESKPKRKFDFDHFKPRPTKYSVGTKVKVVDTKPDDVILNNFPKIDWESSMGKYLGREGIISMVYSDLPGGVYLMAFDEEEVKYVFAEEWLSPIE